MPVCRVCRKQQPSSEIRRAPLGPKCLDLIACARRRGDQHELEQLLHRREKAAA